MSNIHEFQDPETGDSDSERGRQGTELTVHSTSKYERQREGRDRNHTLMSRASGGQENENDTTRERGMTTARSIVDSPTPTGATTERRRRQSQRIDIVI